MPFNRYINGQAATLTDDPTIVGIATQNTPAVPSSTDYSPVALPQLRHNRGPSESMLLFGAAAILVILYVIERR